MTDRPPGMEQLYDYRKALLERFEQQPAEFARVLAGLPEAEWGLRRDRAGRSVHALMAHVRDLEVLAYLQRLRQIIEHDNPTLEPDGFQHWDEARYAADESMESILTAWSQARAEAAQRLRESDPGGWARTGFYPPVGRRTLQWWAEKALAHARGHLADIQAASLARPVN